MRCCETPPIWRLPVEPGAVAEEVPMEERVAEWEESEEKVEMEAGKAV